MTGRQYDLLKTICDTENYACKGCICYGKRICFKYYMINTIYDFPLRSFKYLKPEEKQKVYGKKFPDLMSII